MRFQYKVTEPGGYFMTASIVEWLSVFATAESCDIIVRALAHYRAHRGLRIRAFSLSLWERAGVRGRFAYRCTKPIARGTLRRASGEHAFHGSILRVMRSRASGTSAFPSWSLGMSKNRGTDAPFPTPAREFSNAPGNGVSVPRFSWLLHTHGGIQGTDPAFPRAPCV